MTDIRVAASGVIRFVANGRNKVLKKSWAVDELIRHGSYAEAIAWVNVVQLHCRSVAQSEPNALIEAITHRDVDSYTRRAGYSITVIGTEFIKGSLWNNDVGERFICIQAMMIYNLITIFMENAQNRRDS